MANQSLDTKMLDDEFEVLFERYYPRVSNFFSRRGFSPDESEDLAQRTFLKAYRSWERHRRRYDLVAEARAETWERYRKDETSWIFTIALNTWRNEIRRQKTRKRDAQEVDLEQLREVGWEPPALEDDPEVEYLGRQRLRLLEEKFDTLPPAMRRCFELRFAQGLKYREIALILKISIQSVRSQLHQARKRLEELFADQ